jgi:hypothetical protein
MSESAAPVDVHIDMRTPAEKARDQRECDELMAKCAAHMAKVKAKFRAKTRGRTAGILAGTRRRESNDYFAELR